MGLIFKGFLQNSFISFMQDNWEILVIGKSNDSVDICLLNFSRLINLKFLCFYPLSFLHIFILAYIGIFAFVVSFHIRGGIDLHLSSIPLQDA